MPDNPPPSQSNYVAAQQPLVGNGAFTLDAQSVQRLFAAARFVERTYQQRPYYGKGRNGAVTWARFFRVTGSISAASGATYGTGTGVAQEDSGTAFSDSTEPNATQTIKNVSDKTIASGASSFVLCVWANGKWWAGVAPCAILS